jgi:hypothetical protein
MSNFSSQCVQTAATPPDPRKHVNFVPGMVLGVEDLQQEFVYHQYQNHLLARDAIGYGTLSGLKVEWDGTQIAVLPGAALSPRGQLIRVAPKQCASLDAWLRLPETQQRLTELGVAAAATFTAHVVLCFRDCQTDPLPIPGEPCRCDSEAMAASRITDDFRLELRLEPPVQHEENAIRDFAEWLRQIRTTSADGGYASVAEFLAAIRTAAQDLNAPLESPPDFLYGSPPETLVIPCCHLCEYLRAALHLWVTELRPLWQARWSAKTGGGCGCHGEEHDEGRDAEECLLLAALHVTLGGSTTSVAGVEVDESRRPFVVHLRMLQELLLCGRGAACCNDHSFATILALDQNTLRIWVHHPAFVTFTESALSLEINGQALSGFTVTQVDTSGEPDSAFNHNVFDVELGASPPVPLEDGQRIVARFDTRLIVENTSPPRTLAELIRHGCVCYPDLADDFITVFNAVVLPASSLILAGDATGPVHDNTVEGILTFPVDITSPATPPGTDPVLGFDGSRWHLTGQPQPATTPALPDVPGPLGTIGILPTYALADHQHPLPAIPAPATNLPSRVTAGAPVPADIGVDTAHFALADHRHRLDRIQLGHLALVPDPAGSDVRGILERNIVVGLQGVSLANPALNSAHDRFVLTYRQSTTEPAGRWIAEAATGGAAIQATTGTITFLEVKPDELRVSKPLPHRIKGVKQVCIRLGLEIPPDPIGVPYDEDTDSFFPRMPILTPNMVARFNQGTPDFFQILLRAPAEQGQARHWVIRWWAFPVLHVSDDVVGPGDGDGIPEDLLQFRVRLAGPSGPTITELARGFGVETAALRPVLDRMRANGRLVVVGGRFRIPQ